MPLSSTIPTTFVIVTLAPLVKLCPAVVVITPGVACVAPEMVALAAPEPAASVLGAHCDPVHFNT